MEEGVDSDAEEKCDSADVVDDDLSESIESISEDHSSHEDKTFKSKEFHATSVAKNELIPITELDVFNLKSEIDEESKLFIQHVEPSVGEFETEDKAPDEKFIKVTTDENDSLRRMSYNNKSGNSENSNGKKKMKEGKPFLKVVVRRLPASMTKQVFLEQVSPLPPHDYFYFVPSYILAPSSFSRAYFNFTDQSDLLNFTRTFDNYVFIDNKGHEFPAVVEFAPYQRVPRERGRKRDPLMGTIEKESLYTTFREQLVTEALETSKPINKQHYFETEINESEEVKTTPLLEYLRTRRAERIRQREEKREERRRREADRKRQRLLREQQEHDQDLDPSPTPDVKLLQHPKEKKEVRDKETKKSKGKDKDDKYGKPNEGRPREFKNKGGKGFKEEKIKIVDRKEEKRRKSEEVKEEEEMEEEVLVAEEEKVWVERKKWKNVEKRSRRKEDKKKEGYEKKRTGKGFKTRKGSGDVSEEVRGMEKAVSKETSGGDTKEETSIREEARTGLTREDDDCPAPGSNKPSEGRSVSLDKEENMSECQSSKPERISQERTFPDSKQSKEGTASQGKSSKQDQGKDPRAQRRIRNKDRPSIEIYRPGMGKLSRQRISKEASSGTVSGTGGEDSPARSPSPPEPS